MLDGGTMRRISAVLFLMTGLFFTSQIGPPKAGALPPKQNIDYDQWADVLKAYVDRDGRVDYHALKRNSAALKSFIHQIENADISLMPPQEEKAFWINAYNAITLNVVVDKYPVKSIRHINFALVWEIGRKVAQGKKSLGDIEHKILRPLGDPRIHFAINCASISCPKLPDKPFYPSTLDEQLDLETRKFMNDSEKIQLDKKANILYYSAILDWFKEDFLNAAPDVLTFIKRYINDEDREYLDNNKVTLKVLKYDWSLNKQ